MIQRPVYTLNYVWWMLGLFVCGLVFWAFLFPIVFWTSVAYAIVGVGWAVRKLWCKVRDTRS